MELPALSPSEFFFGIVLVGMLMLLAVYIPVQLAAKFRRMHAVRTRITCRICGYRFVRRDEVCTCSHCGARNR